MFRPTKVPKIREILWISCQLSLVAAGLSCMRPQQRAPLGPRHFDPLEGVDDELEPLSLDTDLDSEVVVLPPHTEDDPDHGPVETERGGVEPKAQATDTEPTAGADSKPARPISKSRKVPAAAEKRRGETRAPTSAIRDAVRDLLSSDRGRAQRARRRLLRAGIDIAPELRYWVQRVQYDTDRVSQMLDEILRRAGRPTEGRRSDSIEAFFSHKISTARFLAQTGNYRQARSLSEALLTLRPESAMSWELRRLVRECRDRVLAEELEPRVDLGEFVYEVGDEPTATFRLINRSPEQARIEIPDGVLGQLRIVVTLRGIDGSRSSFESPSIIRVSDLTSLTLRPGESWEQEVRLPDLSRRIPIGGVVARVRITGNFRPFRWQFDGDRESNVAITVAPTEYWIVPPAQKRKIKSPLQALVAALVFDKTEAFLVGGQLSVWASRRDPVLNEKLIDLLIGHLDEFEGVRLRLARGFLVEATGKQYKENEDWKRWWALSQGSRAKTQTNRQGADRSGGGASNSPPSSGTPPSKG
ncbi:MAG: hypothetical protein AAF517_14405 [Planctomycetota bacterium]